MKKKVSIIIISIMCLVLFSLVSAFAITIDFNQGIDSATWTINDYIDVGDYRFTIKEKSTDENHDITAGFLSHEHWPEPKSSFLQSYYIQEFWMTRIDGGNFSFHSLDFGRLNPLFHDRVEIASDSFSNTVIVPDSYSWCSYDLGTDYFNTSKIIFKPIFEDNNDGVLLRYTQIDNLVLTSPNDPIPEPSTILLFGIGLLGLTGISKRKITK